MKLQVAKMEHFEYSIKIPHERVAVLIGQKGEVKKELEKRLHIKLEIDSHEGDVLMTGSDSIDLVVAQDIVRAIGRGFNPDVAFELMKENRVFETIDISEYSGKSKKKMILMRSRAIGTDGKARKTIEELSNTNIIIYGKTIGIIGEYQWVDLARRAFESLLAGARHSTVYAWLEKHSKDLKTAGMFNIK